MARATIDRNKFMPAQKIPVFQSISFLDSMDQKNKILFSHYVVFFPAIFRKSPMKFQSKNQQKRHYL